MLKNLMIYYKNWRTSFKTLDNYIATSSKYNKKEKSTLLVSTLGTYIFELTERKPLIIPVIIEQ